MPEGVRRAARLVALASACAEEAAAQGRDEEPLSPRTSPLNVPSRVLRDRSATLDFVLNARNIAAGQRFSQPIPSRASRQRRAASRDGAPATGNPPQDLTDRYLYVLTEHL